MHPKYKEAVDLHRTGQIKKAKNICLEILEDEPKNFDILHLLGIISFQLKDYKKSSELISNFNLLSIPDLSAKFFKVLVKPLLNPVKCVPPSYVDILFT